MPPAQCRTPFIPTPIQVIQTIVLLDALPCHNAILTHGNTSVGPANVFNPGCTIDTPQAAPFFSQSADRATETDMPSTSTTRMIFRSQAINVHLIAVAVPERRATILTA